MLYQSEIYLLINCIVSITCGWLGKSLSSYFSEKGKNLATKEDITNITSKIESVKNQFNRQHLRSQAFIERQLSAFDCILTELYKMGVIYLDEKYSINGFVNNPVLENELLDDNGKIEKIVHLFEEHQIYLSDDLNDMLLELQRNIDVLNNSKKQFIAVRKILISSNQSSEFNIEEYEVIDDSIKLMKVQLKKEIFEG